MLKSNENILDENGTVHAFRPSQNCRENTANRSKNPMISIIVPTFNRPLMLLEALDSIMKQTYTNFEIIVVNDDGVSVESEIKKFDKKKKIIYVVHNKNQDQASARNTGLKIARGKYIAYLDDDDIYYPEHLETLLSFLESTSYKVAYSDAYRAHQIKRGDSYEIVKRDVPYSIDFSKDLLLVQNIAPVQCFMHEKSCIEEVGFFDSTFTPHEDWEFWIRMSQKFNFKHIKSITSEFRSRVDGSNMTSGRRNDFLRTMEIIYKKYENLVQVKPSIIESRSKILVSLKSEVRSHKTDYEFSIIIPVNNQLEYTQKCLDALRKNTPEDSYEIIIVNNGSSDGTKEYLKVLKGNVKIISNKMNSGFAKACNQGARQADGKYLVFLNNDTIPQENWLPALAETLKRDNVGIVGSKLVFPDKTIQHAGVVFTDSSLPYHIYEGLPEHLDFLNREEEYSAVTGACLGIRKELFFQIGMFDEAYLNGLEDIDLCLKIKKLGKKVIYQPKSELIHFASRTEGRQNHMPRNRQIFLNKWRQWIRRDDFHYYLKNNYIPNFSTINAKAEWVHYKKPLISIIVVTYNSEKTLENCLKSIDGNMTTLYEIILVDNASKKDVRKVIEPFESKLPLSIIQNSQNLGFSAAANQGIKQAQGDYIVLLNPDTAVTYEWGVRLMRHFSSDTGAVGPISNYAAGRQNFSHYADRRWQGDFSLEKLSTFIYDKNKGQSVETKLLIGFCLMIKREAVEKAGLLDENLFLGNDDLDYSLRLREAGYKLKIAADTFIYHEGQHSFKMLEAEKKAALMQESLDRFYEKLETKFGEGRVPSSTELWGIDILGTPTRRKNGRRPEPLLTPKKEASFLKKRRVALIYDNQVRPDTTGEYCRRALQSICKVTHFLPDDMDKIRPGAFDLYLFIDDGLEYPIPFQLRPNAWWVIDTHLRYEKDLEKARLFDYVFAAQRDGAEKLERDGIRNVFWLPLAADPAVHKKYALPKKYDVSFVGHLAPGQRNELLQAIRETVPNRFIGQKFFDEMARIYSESKIVFNRSLKNDINMRVFEAMATGSLLLTNDLADNGLEVLFKTGEQVAVYSGKNDLLRKIEYYLKHPDERERTAREGRKAILKEHTYPKRMRALLETVLTLETQKPAFSTDKLTSIIVLTCNGIDYTKQCLSSIRENTEAPYELIVVDNGSTDGTRDYLQSLENVKVLLNAENRGFAAGNNRGMREAKGDFIVWLNNDTVVTKGWLKGLIQAVQLSPDAGMAGPRSNYVQNPYQQIKNVPYKTMEDMHRFAGEFSRQHKEVYLTATKLVGFCLLMKRSVMDRVGILDESFGLGNFEDDDYCVRVRKAGYHLIIAGAVFIHHYGNRAFKENDISYKTMMRKNLKKFTEKWKHEIEFRNGVYYLKDDLHNFARAEITTGEKHFARDDLSSARSHFLKAVEWEPKNAQAWNNLGVVHWKETKFQQAFENFKTALTVSPEYSDAQENLLQLAREVDLSDRLVKWCRQMPDAAGNLSLLYEIGKLLLGKNRTAEAQDCFQKILRIRGTSIEGRIGLALVAWERERFDEALQKMDEITGIAPGNKELILQYALMAYQLGQASEAIALLKNYLAAHSDEKMEQTLGFLEEHLREEQTVSTEAAEAV